MFTVLNQYLDCTDCMEAISVAEAFDIAFQSWPKQQLVAYRCPECGTTNHLQLESQAIRQGYLDGFPSPNHVMTRQLRIESLTVTMNPSAIVIQSLNRTWRIAAG